jgi:glycosyltransferase involved in cell wall biosynthesis
MGEPLVVCVMLVDGREAMVRRAIASFRAQTYQRKRMLIYDTTDDCINELEDLIGPDETTTILESRSVNHHGKRKTVGYLRNRANRGAIEDQADLIAHWDSDDWSHPRRLEEQIALLEGSGKMCVGYREVLFWDTRNTHVDHGSGAAWLYCHPDPRWAAGASFLYWRELWEQQPFDDAPHEDQRWWLTPLVSNRCVGVSGLWPRRSEPRMICQIHGQNTEAYNPLLMLAGSQVWKRAPEFDAHCAEVMCLSR